jgi:hypothetical protein
MTRSRAQKPRNFSKTLARLALPTGGTMRLQQSPSNLNKRSTLPARLIPPTCTTGQQQMVDERPNSRLRCTLGNLGELGLSGETGNFYLLRRVRVIRLHDC